LALTRVGYAPLAGWVLRFFGELLDLALGGFDDLLGSSNRSGSVVFGLESRDLGLVGCLV